MSVKFEKETIQTGPVPVPPPTEKHGLVHRVGERLTGGETTKGYLAVRVFRI
jgi:hypothetical protein